MSALSELLNQANTEGWSAREIARRADNGTHFATVNDYLKGRHGKPSEQVLETFSSVLRVPMSKLRQAAALPPGEDEVTEPAAEWRRLDRRQQRVVNEMIRLLAETKAGDGDVDRDAAPMKRDEPKVADVLEARRKRGREDELRPAAQQGDPADADEVLRIARDERRRQTDPEK